MWKYLENKIINNKAALTLIIVGFCAIIIFTLFGHFINFYGKFDPLIFSYYGGFVGGILGPILSLSGFIIIYLSFKSQNNQHFENLLFKQIDSLNNYNVYNPETRNFTTYMNFFKEFYSKVLEGDNSLLGTYERNENVESGFKTQLEKYNSYIHDYIRRLNSIIDFIKKEHPVNNENYISILFNQLSIFEIFYLQTMTVRMLETGIYGDNKKHEDCRNKLYEFLTNNSYIPNSLTKNDNQYYPTYLKILNSISINIPKTTK